MTYNHFFPETTFFIDYPNFTVFVRYQTIHSCDLPAVIRELDGLKNRIWVH